MASDASLAPPRTWGRSTVPYRVPARLPRLLQPRRHRRARPDRRRSTAIATRPSTDGYICGKVRRFDRRVYSEERMLHPGGAAGPEGPRPVRARLLGRGARSRSPSGCATRATAFGAESVLPYYYGGSNGLLTNELEDARFFRRFGASRLARTICAAPTGAAATAMYGKMAGVAYPDYEHARLIVIWGCNPSASGIHLVPHIKRAQKAGAQARRHRPAPDAARPSGRPASGRAARHRPRRSRSPSFARCSRTGRADEAFLDGHTTGADGPAARRRPAGPIERAAAEARHRRGGSPDASSSGTRPHRPR